MQQQLTDGRTDPVLLHWISFSWYRSHLETRHAHSLFLPKEFLALRTNLQTFIAKKYAELEQKENMSSKIYFQMKLVCLTQRTLASVGTVPRIPFLRERHA
jgi:hypothetical protein